MVDPKGHCDRDGGYDDRETEEERSGSDNSSLDLDDCRPTKRARTGRNSMPVYLVCYKFTSTT